MWNIKKKENIIKNMQVQGMLTLLFFNKNQQNIILGLCLGSIKNKKSTNNSNDLFKSLIKPYIIKSMEYKL